MLCHDSVPQTPLRTFEPTGRSQQKSRGFKQENLIQVSGQLGKGEDPVNASSEVKAEGETWFAARAWPAQPQDPTVNLPSPILMHQGHLHPLPQSPHPQPSPARSFLSSCFFGKSFRIHFYIGDVGLLFSSPPWCSPPAPQPLAFAWLMVVWLYSSPSLCTLSLPLKLSLSAERLGCAIYSRSPEVCGKNSTHKACQGNFSIRQQNSPSFYAHKSPFSQCFQQLPSLWYPSAELKWSWATELSNNAYVRKKKKNQHTIWGFVIILDNIL